MAAIRRSAIIWTSCVYASGMRPVSSSAIDALQPLSSVKHCWKASCSPRGWPPVGDPPSRPSLRPELSRVDIHMSTAFEPIPVWSIAVRSAVVSAPQSTSAPRPRGVRNTAKRVVQLL